MRKFNRKFLSILLTLAMVVSMVPMFGIAAFAADEVTLFVNSETANDDAERSNEAMYKTIGGALTKAYDGDTIKLTSDITENVTIPASKTITLDLNGHVLKGKTNGNVIYNKGTLTIQDSNTATVHYFKYKSDAAWEYLSEHDTPGDEVNLTNFNSATLISNETVIAVPGGCITGGNNSSSAGGGVYNDTNCTLSITGGSICGNSAKDGGGLYSAGSTTLTLRGVNIIGNHATNSFGGVLFNATNGNNCTIGDTVKIFGNTLNSENNNLALWDIKDKAPITLDNLVSGSQIYIRLENSQGLTTGAFTTNGTNDDAQYFHSDDNTYEIKYVAASAELEVAEHLELSYKTKWYDENPDAAEFTISNTAELEALAALVNSGNSFSGKTVKLADGFDDTTPLTTPIGKDYNNPFKGTFDGNGKPVALNITGALWYAGLFGSVAEGSTIENVKINGSVTTSANYAYVGGIAGYNLGTIKNCGSSVEAKATTNDQPNAGGLVGGNFGTIANCYTTGNVTVNTTGGANFCRAGGIVSVNWGTVSNCFATGTVSGQHAYGVSAFNTATVTDCYSTMSTLVGGNGTVTNCYQIDSDKKVNGEPLVTALNNNVTSNFASNSTLHGWVADGENYPTLASFAGAGTETCPYTLKNTAELEKLAALVNSGDSFSGKYLKLANSFNDTTALTTPIGKDFGNSFKGIFDGNGKSVNIEITNSIYKNAGLFGYIDGAGTIKNVGTFGTVTASSNAGGVVGMSDGNSSVINCCSTCDVSIPSNSDGGAGGIVGSAFESSVTNCYAAGNISSSGAESGGIKGIGSGTVTNCYYLSRDGVSYTFTDGTALSEAQMKGATGETDDTWTEITVSGGDHYSETSGKLSLADALNDYVFAGDNQQFCTFWGVMNDSVNSGYPAFMLSSNIYLCDGKAYSNEEHSYEISVKGITYDTENTTYVFDGVNLPLFQDRSSLFIIDTDAKIELKGENQLGFKANTEQNTQFGYAYFGIVAQNGNLTISGSGKLTIYSLYYGIYAKNITISGGTVNANASTTNSESYGIIACGNSQNTTINITGGTVNTKGKTYAIASVYTKPNDEVNLYPATLTIADTLEVTGAKETYTAGTTNSLTNKGGTEYVTIKAKQPSSGGGGGGGSSNTTVPVSGDKDTIKVTATVSNSNATIKNITPEEIATAGTGSSVAMDLSSLSKSVTGVTIPKSTFENIAASEAAGLEIKMPNGTTVVFDKETLSAVAAQAKGANIQLVIDKDTKAESSMTSAQKETVKEMNNAVVLDAYFVSNGTRISDFKGGEAELTAEYSTDKAVKVWFVAEDGAKTEVPCTWDGKTAKFTVSHFSHYVIETVEGSEQESTTTEGSTFTDVTSTDYFYEPVLWAAKNGITGGMDATHFAPNGITTRAQMVTFLWRHAGSPEPTAASCPFTDVDSNAYYYKAVLWAVEKGITEGTSTTTFSPDVNVSRCQAVTFLWRYNGAIPFTNMTADGPAPSPFSDVATDAYYYSAVLWAKTQGITDGTSATTFSPDDDCTRGQIVTFLYRSVEK